MQYEPELGQAVFGCPSSEYPCPTFVEAGLSQLAAEIERVEWNRTQQTFHAPTGNNGGEYFTDVFLMRAYYWGDCECGWDDIDYEGTHDAECYYTELNRLMVAAGVHEWSFGNGTDWEDLQKIKDGIYRQMTEKYGLPMQGCAVHCTCTRAKRFEDWCEANKRGPAGHAIDCPVYVPNFKCGNFEVRWYKYMGRGMSMNQDIDANDFFKIIEQCLESVRRRDTCAAI